MSRHVALRLSSAALSDVHAAVRGILRAAAPRRLSGLRCALSRDGHTFAPVEQYRTATCIRCGRSWRAAL
jgi:hypothetical protein